MKMQKKMLQEIGAFSIYKKVFVIKKGKLLTAHRSTNYLCCLPTLEDLSGAGRIRLARAQIYKIKVVFHLKRRLILRIFHKL